jgi:hypothetical protein
MRHRALALHLGHHEQHRTVNLTWYEMHTNSVEEFHLYSHVWKFMKLYYSMLWKHLQLITSQCFSMSLPLNIKYRLDNSKIKQFTDSQLFLLSLFFSHHCVCTHPFVSLWSEELETFVPLSLKMLSFRSGFIPRGEGHSFLYLL